MTNIYIALAAAVFCMSGQVMIAGRIDVWPLPLLIFFSTWGVYQLSRWRYHRIYEGTDDERDNLFFWQESHRRFTFVSIVVSFIAAAIIALFTGRHTIELLILTGLISFFYSSAKGLRRLPFAKIFLIAFVWAAIGSWYPAAEIDSSPAETEVILLFVHRFLFILTVTLPFDMKDIVVDSGTGTKTIPSLLGFKRTRWLVILLCLLLVVFIKILYDNGLVSIVTSIGLVFFMAAIATYTYLIKPTIAKWKVMWFYDGLIIVQSLWICISALYF